MYGFLIFVKKVIKINSMITVCSTIYYLEIKYQFNLVIKMLNYQNKNNNFMLNNVIIVNNGPK